MNNEDIDIWFDSGVLYAKYYTGDREDEDMPVITAEVPAESIDDRLAMKKLRSNLARLIDLSERDV